MNGLKSLRIVLLAVCASICLAASTAAAPVAIKLTILHTNDIHGHLLPFDYIEPGAHMVNVGGAARRASLIRSIKAGAGNPVLVMDAGDVFQRGPLDSLMGAPDFQVMNAVPYDVMTLGNNEFKATNGPEALVALMQRVKEAHFPVLSANVFDATSGKLLVEAYRIFDIGGLKIGVFGLTTPRIAGYEQTRGLRVEDPIAAARRTVSELKGKADVIIALTHLGFPADLELAAAVPGITAIVGGDSHTAIDSPILVRRSGAAPAWAINGTIVCQDGEWGVTVGRLDLDLRRDDDGSCFASAYSGKLLKVDSTVTPAPDVAAIVDSAAAPYQTVVGRLSTAVTIGEAPNWIAARMQEAAQSQVGIEPRDAVEQGLHTGEVTALGVRSMLPFVNQIVRASLTGKQIYNYLLSSPDAGLAGARLSNGLLYIGGKKADDAATYTVAIEEYCAAHSSALAGCKFTPLMESTADVIVHCLESKPTKPSSSAKR